jgi:hypothetical protein
VHSRVTGLAMDGVERHAHHGGHEVAGVDTLESRILLSYVTAQCHVLLRRHRYEDFLLARTLADHHQHAAWEAKRGHLSTARQVLLALEDLHPSGEELSLTCRITADPVWALIDWKEGRCAQAIGRIRIALKACSELAARYNHNYLSAKRIYLASRIARVYISCGASERASHLVEALTAVTDGTVDRWPFENLGSLEVPLRGDERIMIASELEQLAAHVKSVPGTSAASSSAPTEC